MNHILHQACYITHNLHFYGSVSAGIISLQYI